MSMGYRSTLAGVIAAILFAVTWPVCDQLAGLSVGASSAVAGVLAVAAFGMTLRATRPRLWSLQSSRAQPNDLHWPVASQQDDVVVGQAGAPDERGRESPDTPVIPGTSTPRARNIPARERARTLVTQHIQFIVEDAGMRVRKKRKTIGEEVWEEHLHIQWSAVTAIGFAIGRYDPVVALYAWAAPGNPHHLADSRFLNNLQWTQLGELIAEASSGRLTLDVASRYNPRSIWPDL
jgi:hypothetical protein